MHSRADLLAGIPLPPRIEPKVLKPILRTRKFAPRRQRFRGTKSGFKGVIVASHCTYRRWKAYIHFMGQYRTIGYYRTKEDAAKAYNSEARRLYGPSAFLNPI